MLCNGASTLSEWHVGGTADDIATAQCVDYLPLSQQMPPDILRARLAFPDCCQQTSKKLQWLRATVVPSECTVYKLSYESV